MCSRELCEAMQRQDRRQPPRIKTQRESGAEAAKHVSLPKTATEDITLLGQGPRYCVGEDGRRLLAESVDPNSIATSMDDQLSTNPDDCDGQRRPGLSVLIHQCSRDRGFMAWLSGPRVSVLRCEKWRLKRCQAFPE